MKHIKKSNLNRSLYILDGKVISIRTGTKFQKMFSKWYLSDSIEIPSKIDVYITFYKNKIICKKEK